MHLYASLVHPLPCRHIMLFLHKNFGIHHEITRKDCFGRIPTDELKAIIYLRCLLDH